MVAIENRIIERTEDLNSNSTSPNVEHFAVDDKRPVDSAGTMQPSGLNESHPQANDQAKVRQEVVVKTGYTSKVATKKEGAPPTTAGTKPAKSKVSKRVTRPPKFNYVPQAKLDAELTRLEVLSRAVSNGDSMALDTLRCELDHLPHIWRRLADLQILIEERLMELVAGKDPLRAESFRKRCSELRFELHERQPCSLATEMAASRVVATYMFVQMLELRALERPEELTNIKQLEQAERRYQAAMRMFLLARRSDSQLQQLAS